MTLHIPSIARASLIAPCLLWFFVSGFSLAAGVRVSASDSMIVVENDVLRRSLPVSRKGGESIDVGALVWRRTGEDLFAREGDAAWFECSINGQILSSRQPVWRFAGYQRRTMKHGGEETLLQYVVDRGPAGGLRVVYWLQMYPSSGVLRERLQLFGTPGRDLRLTMEKGGVHLVFPAYRIRNAEGTTMREVNLSDWGGVSVEGTSYVESYDERVEEPGTRIGRNLSANYMYHPHRREWQEVPASGSDHKGPVLLFVNPSSSLGWFVAYEHGSPDGDPEQKYLAIRQARHAESLLLSVCGLNGAYFDRERLSSERPLSTVWTEFGVFEGKGCDAGEEALREFLLKWICEETSSRAPLFYYNTWGMQRERSMKGGDPREFLTMQRILEDVAYVSELGADLFVLDDGWQDRMGDWRPNPRQLPEGLDPLRRALAERKIMMGIWIAALAVDSTSQVIQQHPEWLIRNEGGVAPTGRWNKKMFCFVSSYRAYFVSVCKRLIDSGVRYFKWDGIDKYLCSSPEHLHGDDTIPPEQRRGRHGYEMIRAVTEAAAELKTYRPDVMIEFDVTEPLRNVGLAFLSEGRYFWMNNGASAYGDHSQYRAKSTRMIHALWSGLFPPALQTYANYPHNSPMYKSQRYNVLSSLIGGYGFWGDLSQMSRDDRLRVGQLVALAKRVWPVAAQVKTEIMGKVGGSPEIYTAIDRQSGEGQVIAFSGTAGQHRHVVAGVAAGRVLAVLRNAYTMSNDTLAISLNFPMPDAAREVFLMPNGGRSISITSSTSWLSDAAVDSAGRLRFISGAPGRQVILWPGVGKAPTIAGSKKIETRVTRLSKSFYSIETVSFEPETEIRITGGNE